MVGVRRACVFVLVCIFAVHGRRSAILPGISLQARHLPRFAARSRHVVPGLLETGRAHVLTSRAVGGTRVSSAHLSGVYTVHDSASTLHAERSLRTADARSSLTGEWAGFVRRPTRLFEWASMSEWAAVALLRASTLRVATLALLCPLACSWVGVIGRDFDPTLISLAIATPSAISINAAYYRRERLMTTMASMRAATYSLNNGFDAWASASQARAGRNDLRGVFSSIKRFVSTGDVGRLSLAYESLTNLSATLEVLRRNPPDHAQTAGKLTECLYGSMLSDSRTLVQSVETIRAIRTSSTPYLLRGFTQLATLLFPVLFAPYFASIASDAPLSAYLLSLFFGVANVSLVNIQEALENPFDGDTIDDININLFFDQAREWRQRDESLD